MATPPLNVKLIYSDGKPTQAIVDVEALEALLQAAEELEDIRYLDSLKEEALEFRSFDEYLREREAERQTQRDHLEGRAHAQV